MVRPRRRLAETRAVSAEYGGAQRHRAAGRQFADRRSESLAGARLRLAVEVALKPLLDLAARRSADLLRDRLAALEQQHGRDPPHSVAAGDVGVLVDVELGDRHLLAELVGNLLERRRDHPARTAPLGP